MSEKTIFQKIADKEIPAELVFEDPLCVCFRDLNPQAPTHLLLVPREPIPRIALAGDEDRALLGHMMTRIGPIAEQEGIARDGFRVVINNGRHGGEAVPHLHIHLLGGRPMTWPPG